MINKFSINQMSSILLPLVVLVVLPLNSTLASDDSEDSIPVFDLKGNSIRFFSANKLSRSLEGTITKVNESTLHTLNLLPSSSCEMDSSWELRTVSVGLSISIEAGLGPIISVGAGAQLRLLYTSNDDVVNP